MHIPLLIMGGILSFTGYYTWKRIKQTNRSPFPYVITLRGTPDLEIYANLLLGKMIAVIGAGVLVAGLVLPMP